MHLVGVTVLALTMLSCQMFSANAWVPLIDSANLALHEAGHPVIGIFSACLMVYGSD